MAKRKFSEFTGSGRPSPGEEIQQLLSQGQKQLFRALKLARGFERQKLGRRQKDAAKKGDGEEQRARLQAEVDAVKSLDLNTAAEFYLRRSLARTTSVAAAPDFPAWLREWAKRPSPFQGTASANVTARLFKAVPVRTAMDEITKRIRRALRVDTHPTGLKVSERDATKKKQGSETSHDRAQSAARSQDGQVYAARSRSRSLDSSESFDRFEQYVDRVAGSSDNDSPHDDASHDPIKQNDTISAVYQEKASAESHDGFNLGSKMDDEGAMPPAQASKAKTRKSSEAKAPTPPNGTTFLPSLTMGGYISGSDSNRGSSDEEAGDLQARKNRRGQRARRAIWEKKYGSGARHVKRNTESRDAGWDAKRGATEDKPRRARSDAKPAGREAKQEPANGAKAAGRAPSKRTRDDEGKLHPSWEAAKQAKTAKQKIAFAGTKIVFE